MAMSTQRIGELVGYKDSSYEKKDKENPKRREWVDRHEFLVLVKQRVDPKTKLPQECAVFTVVETSNVLGDDLKFGQKVSFWEEERRNANGVFTVGVGLEKV